MNTNQKTAFLDPCFHAEETTKVKFKHYEQERGKLLSVILTANIGLEWAAFFNAVALWHCSIAIISGTAARPVKFWTAKDKERVAVAIARNLRGVGDATQKHIEYGHIAVHFRKPMTETEIAAINLSKRVAA